MVEIGAVLATVKGAIDIAGKVTQNEIKAELLGKILELRTQTGELIEEVQRIRAENRELREKLETKAALAWRPPFYWAEGDDVPFCPKCWESDRVAAHLSAPYSSQRRTTRRRICRVCRIEYKAEEGA